MTFDAFKAIRLTPYYARQANWASQFNDISGYLGFTQKAPTAKEFVTAIQKWQAKHPPISADGVLGDKTWKSMLPLVKAYTGSRPDGSSLPDWLKSASSSNSGKNTLAPTQNPSGSSKRSPEDELMDEMVQLAIKMREDIYTAQPISYRQIKELTSAASVMYLESVGGLTPTLRVGQLWPGLAGGTRLIIGLSPGYKNGAVLFMTDSGRVYFQRFEGWANDYNSSMWANINTNLEPILTMLETEAKFIQGAISALHPGAAAFIFTMNTLQWYAVNKQAISAIMDAMPPFIEDIASIKVLAPTLFDKVFKELLKDILTSIPSSMVKDPKVMAFMIGQLLVKVARLVLLRDFSTFREGLELILGELSKASIEAAKMTVPIAVATAKSIPASISAGAKQLVKDLAKLKINIFENHAVEIIKELMRNPAALQKTLKSLQTTGAALSAALKLLKSP